ncbi:MAG: hypothetical protein IPK26_18320 [Planctomycetes bacterium]|nr:hypothetical protein [Planctomycetota bacterium]
MTSSSPSTTGEARAVLALLQERVPWLLAPELGVCVVGTHALAIACADAGLQGPRPADLDLAWALSVEAGQTLLQQHGVHVPTTDNNQDRGTLALKLAGQRLEITSFRAGDPAAPMRERIAADLGARDMTVGALAVELATGVVHDPTGGLEHWRKRRIVPVGDPAARVHEHAVRWLRWYRKAHEWGFQLDPTIRSLRVSHGLLAALPTEAIAQELRALLLKCRSPGRCLLDLHEDGLLDWLSPDLARQFDGRPAGPQRWHPEVSQALHLILALEWAVAATQDLDQRDRLAVLLAVLCHDFGKSHTPAAEWPGHSGHEHAGLPWVERFLDRWPGLADPRARMLALHVCELHQKIRQFDELRAGTQVEMFDRCFRPKDYPCELFALAIGADTGGRLGLADSGEAMRARVLRDLQWLRRVCGSVDAAALRARIGDDVEKFKAALHQARAEALHAHRHDAR